MTKIIGCIHLLPLPGSPGYSFNKEEIMKKALYELEIYKVAGLDGVIIENTSDIPYLKGFVYPETLSLLSIICNEIRKTNYNLYLGLQVLAGANIEALAIAYNAGFDFIRVEGFSFASIADEGLIQSCAAELARKRASLRATKSIKIIADIKKKHSSHAITSDLSLTEMAKHTEYMEPDGLVLTGSTTGVAPEIEEVRAVKNSTKVPIYIGSGITKENALDFAKVADYLIVGSYFKKENYWKNDICKEKVSDFMDYIKKGTVRR